MTDAVVDATLAGALAPELCGEVMGPGDGEYERARRVWNAMIDRRPAVIARCRGVADVIRAVGFAREHDLLIAVRGGGHSVAGKGVCDGGIGIDLATMKGIHVPPPDYGPRVSLWRSRRTGPARSRSSAPGGRISSSST